MSVKSGDYVGWWPHPWNYEEDGSEGPSGRGLSLCLRPKIGTEGRAINLTPQTVESMHLLHGSQGDGFVGGAAKTATGAAIGAALLGPVGLIGGAYMGHAQKNYDKYGVVLNFRNGKSCICDLSQKYYEKFTEILYPVIDQPTDYSPQKVKTDSDEIIIPPLPEPPPKPKKPELTLGAEVAQGILGLIGLIIIIALLVNGCE